MKLEISRSFSRTIQVAPYEPVNLFCAAKIEADTNTEDWEAAGRVMSAKLDAFVQNEVEKSAMKFRKIDKQKARDQATDSAERDTEAEVNDDPEITKEV